MQNEETGADDYDGSVIDIGALDAAEADAEAVKDESEDETEVKVEAESPPAVESDDKEKTEVSDGLQKRFDKLAKQIREARDESVAEREKRIDAERRAEEAEAKVPAPTPKTLADFNYDESAYQEHVREEARQEARQIARTEAVKVNREFSEGRKAEETESEYQKRETVFAESKSDFNEKCYDDKLKISQGMAEVIREVDVGPELFYYLGSNPEVAEDIARLSPVTAGMELSAIVTNIRSEKAKAAEKEASNAPPPPKKISGVDAALKKASTDDPASDKLSDDEWFKREDLRQAKLRG